MIIWTTVTKPQLIIYHLKKVKYTEKPVTITIMMGVGRSLLIEITGTNVRAIIHKYIYAGKEKNNSLESQEIALFICLTGIQKSEKKEKATGK